MTVFVLVFQPGPLVVPHGSAAVLRPGWRRHTGGPYGGQIHPETKGGYLPELLPLHVLQRPSPAPRGKHMPPIDLFMCVAHAPDLVTAR